MLVLRNSCTDSYLSLYCFGLRSWVVWWAGRLGGYTGSQQLSRAYCHTRILCVRLTRISADQPVGSSSLQHSGLILTDGMVGREGGPAGIDISHSHLLPVWPQIIRRPHQTINRKYLIIITVIRNRLAG